VALEDVVLDLLGPRWRREARLIVDDRRQRDQNTLTPASFDAVELPVPVAAEPANAVNAAAPKRAGAAVAETVSGAAAPELGTTVAPKQQAPRSRTTLLRIARRHRDSQSEEGGAQTGLRRRAAVAIIVVAMGAGAAGGAVLAGAGKTKHRADPAPARRAAAVAAANRELAGIVAGLAAARNHALTGLLHARSSRDQATAAAAVERVYATAEARVTPLVAKSPAAGPLRATLSSTASAYGRLAAAARLKSPAKWSDASSAVKADETQLQSEVAKL
jgi:hypothetical protein